MPAAAVGAVFEDSIDENLGTPTIIAISLILGGLLLGVADRVPGDRKIEGINARDAVVIGAAQALALNPGTSRSGITMTAGRFLRFDRDAAARISFLMMIPVTAGAVALKMAGLAGRRHPRWAPRADDRRHHHGRRSPDGSPCGGCCASSGHDSFMPFVIYRVVAGVFVLCVVAYRA